jgi:Fe2+ or Zn2+ uptake regulation protein
MDEHQKYLIQKTVHLFFSANRIPTIAAVYREVQNNEEIPNISRSKLYNVLHELKSK